MTPEEFVIGFYIEKKTFLDSYFDSQSKTEVYGLIHSLNLDDKNLQRLKQIVDGVLRDAFYTILMGLDGEALIGHRQEMYKIEDETGNILTGGEIEAYAWEYFHNRKFETNNSKTEDTI